jgi:hypothetical protein
MDLLASFNHQIFIRYELVEGGREIGQKASDKPEKDVEGEPLVS